MDPNETRPWMYLLMFVTRSIWNVVGLVVEAMSLDASNDASDDDDEDLSALRHRPRSYPTRRLRRAYSAFWDCCHALAIGINADVFLANSCARPAPA